MAHHPDAQTGNDARGDTAPRWHAPPRPRGAFVPSPLPPQIAPEAQIPASPPPPRSRADRLGAPVLTAFLLLVVGFATWPIVYDAIAPPRPAPIPSPAPTPTLPRIYTPRILGCFSNLTPVASAAIPVIDRAMAETHFREGYDLPFRASHLTTLVDARLVAVSPGDFGRPGVATATATPTTSQLAWLLTFGRTPSLIEPLTSRFYPEQETSSFTYVLLDATDGATIATCDGIASEVRTFNNFVLPRPPRQWETRRSIGAVWAAGPPGGRVAGWLPFTAAASFGNAIALPGGGGMLVADYYADSGDVVGERIQIVSSTQPPLLRPGADGGTPIALTNGRSARLDNLGEMTVLTWGEGGLWYQIVAVRPQRLGEPYHADLLLRLAATLRSRDER